MLSGRVLGGGVFLVNVFVNFFADSIFSQCIQPTFFKFHTWFFQGLCFHVMPCSFQLVPNFLEIGIFFITIQDIWMKPCRNVDPYEQTHCTQDG